MPREPISQQEATVLSLHGQRLVSFAGCNYLGLAHEPRVLGAARRAIGGVGLSTSASRETSGNTIGHSTLEDELAAFVTRGDPSRAGLLMPDGFTANLAAAQGLATDHGYAVIDERAHASLFDAARLSGLELRVFSHQDAAAASDLLAGLDGPAVVMTDGVFTAHGAVAPLRGLSSVLRDDDTLLVDDCHGFCVLGEGGRGTCDELGIRRQRVIITTTLAKGLGCGGGVVIAPKPFIDRLVRTSSVYVCTTPVSPVVVAAALEALRLVVMEPARVARLRTNAVALRDALAFSGLLCGLGTTEAERTPILAFVAPDAVTGEQLLGTLRDSGVYVPLVSYPGGPAAEYFRASVTSEHTFDQIGLLAESLRGAVEPDAATCPTR